MPLLNGVLLWWVTVDFHIGGSDMPDALAVEFQQFDCYPPDNRQWQNRQAVARPNEMLRPLMLARIKERDRFLRRRIENSLLVRFAAIAMKAGEREVL